MGKSTEIDHESFVKGLSYFGECREGHVRMIPLSEFRDAQGETSRKVFVFEGLIESGILEILLETISE